jgi:hypothetical protein
MTILDDRFNSSEVYIMKKIARWALAFATVMSIPASAMALVGDQLYKVDVLNGAYSYPCGEVRWTYDQPVQTPYGADMCAFFGRWKNLSPLPTIASMYVEEASSAGYDDCNWNAYVGFPSTITLSSTLYPDASYGFDKFQYKHKLFRMILGESYDGAMHGMMQYHPAAIGWGVSMKPGAP